MMYKLPTVNGDELIFMHGCFKPKDKGIIMYSIIVRTIKYILIMEWIHDFNFLLSTAIYKKRIT